MAPHPIAMALADVGDDASTVDKLVEIAYDSSAMNDSAREMMKNVMQWHMTKEDRKLIFSIEDQPQVLPVEITSPLDDEGMK